MHRLKPSLCSLCSLWLKNQCRMVADLPPASIANSPNTKLVPSKNKCVLIAAMLANSKLKPCGNKAANIPAS